MFIYALGMLMCFLLGLYWWMHRSITNNLSPGDDVQLAIELGDSAKKVGQKLQELNLNTGPKAFSFASQLVGLHKELKVGVYSISHGESLASTLTRISSGEGIHAAITFLEGWTFAQVIAEINKNPNITQTLDSSNINTLSKLLADELGLETMSIEGWIFPDTYFFQYGASDQQLIRRAVWLQKKALDEIWEKRSVNSKLSNRLEALNLASIIEKETQHSPDRTLVSSVFHNRLAIKMRLQSDPTIIYGLGEKFDGNLRRHHLKKESSYNSYLRAGLPPTPISNPGRKALLAAVQPADTKALYFVARGDGTSHFSLNFRDHKKAVNFFQKGIGSRPESRVAVKLK
tara:strand:+ start:11339 stop:12373 length:1035 start_codon:yes stop_codon:yes gene_type:complete